MDSTRWYVRHNTILEVKNIIHPGDKVVYSVYHNGEFVAIFYEPTWPSEPSYESLVKAQEHILKALVAKRGWVASKLAFLDQRIFQLQEEMGHTL